MFLHITCGVVHPDITANNLLIGKISLFQSQSVDAAADAVLERLYGIDFGCAKVLTGHILVSADSKSDTPVIGTFTPDGGEP